MAKKADESSESKHKINRRDVLKSVGVSTFALATQSRIGTVRAEETTEIPIIKMRDKYVWKEVPEDWWEHEERAKDAKAKLEEKFNLEKNPAIDGVGFGRQNERRSGYYKSNLVVYFSRDSRPEERPNIPDSVDGVSTTSTETKYGVPNGVCDDGVTCYDDPYDPMPGGVQVGDGSGSVGTATCQVRKNYDVYMATCMHTFTCGGDPSNSTMYQAGQEVGTVNNHIDEDDWVTVNPNGNVGIKTDTLVDQAGTLAGHVTKDGLLDMKGSGETAYKVGRTSCKTSGQVTNVDKTIDTCHGVTADHYYEVDTPHCKGDSGAPNYRTFTFDGKDYIGIIGPHYGGSIPSGCPAYHLHNKHNYGFDFSS